MKIIAVLIVLPFLCVLACTSCGSSDVTGLPDGDDSNHAIVLFESIDDVALYSDPARIRDIAIAGDVLTLKVTYGGGCEKHDFELYGWRGYNKSNPPQALLFLSHNAHGDRCEALITEVLHFSLSPLRFNVFRNRGPVYLRIHDPDSDEPVMPMPMYKF
jgi:hypothetical protein